MIALTLLRYAGGLPDVKEMLRRLALNVLLGNGDAHIKNWSLLYENPARPRLSPAYDLVPTVAYAADETMALGMAASNVSTRLAWTPSPRGLPGSDHDRVRFFQRLLEMFDVPSSDFEGSHFCLRSSDMTRICNPDA
jgi:hypothetical protein